MVFSSLPIYLDPPDWQQQQNAHQQGTVSESNPQLLTPPPLVPNGGGPVRTGSTADRARLAKITQPGAALKCPRCESTNTKFCYYNNYSLTQPRHFCKTCRRYWTNGGNLRNVPVGGGCRKNKKNKTNSSKSSTSTADDQKQVAVSTQPVQITAQLPFMASLQNFSQYGLNFGATSGGAEMGFQQQLSFFEQNNGDLYPFHNEGIDASSSFRVSQLAPLMKNENNQRLNAAENNQYWGANSWTDLSGLNSSTTNHLL